MIVGILIKIHNGDRTVTIIRETFRKASPMMGYWKRMRIIYQGANFFIYRATNPEVKLISSYSDNIRYCPYCECKREFIWRKDTLKKCSVCEIVITNFYVKLCNYGV